MWFTSSDSNAGVYRFDTASSLWIKADTPFIPPDADGSVQYTMRATDSFTLGSVAQIKIHYLSDESVNSGSDGDTIDILNAFGDILPNTDS